MTRSFTLTERDGFRRGAFPTTIPVTFNPGDLPTPAEARLSNHDREDIALQIDVDQTWDDGSVQTARLVFGARVPALGSERFILDYGPGVAPNVDPPNPFTVESTSKGCIVRQGPLTYTVLLEPYTVVSQATCDRDQRKGKGPLGPIPPGLKHFLRTGSSPPHFVFEDGDSVAASAGEIAIETEGPCAGRLRVDGVFGTIAFTQWITFYSRVSWCKIDTALTGKVSDGTRLQIDTDLDLRVNPIQVASGARQRNDGRPTSWMVVTNDESTVGIASMDGWGETGAVRFESNVDARIRVLLPAAGEIPSLWYHYLITPPADHHHTPAPAMPTELEVRFE